MIKKLFPSLVATLLLAVMLLFGCSTPGPSPTATPPAPPESAPTEAIATAVEPTSQPPSPTESIASPAPTTDPSTRLSGVPEADAVIPALLAHDAEAIHELIHYSALPCTTAEGLGGPPKCIEGEAEGTLVEVLPTLSTEGSHVRPDGMNMLISLLQTDQLYAVYGLSEAVFTDDAFPRGRYGILFISDEENAPSTTVQVTENGIVRIDYHLGVSPDEVMARESAVLLLAPQQ